MKVDRTSSPDFRNDCVCLHLNRAARGVTRRYDAAFRPLGVTSGQFSILGALSLAGQVPLSRLAEILGMDRTTLNRNVRPLEEAALVTTLADEKDARIRRLAITEAGRAKLSEVVPVWERMQKDSQNRLAGREWKEMSVMLTGLS